MTKSSRYSVRDEVFELGMETRRKILGKEHVDKSWKRAEEDKFSLPLQEMVTGLAWGAVWGRPGLEKKQRSLATVSMLIALNRQHELAAHLRGALNAGWSKEELRELVLHSSVYCGMPAAIDAFRRLMEVLETVEAEGEIR